MKSESDLSLLTNIIKLAFLKHLMYHFRLVDKKIKRVCFLLEFEEHSNVDGSNENCFSYRKTDRVIPN